AKQGRAAFAAAFIGATSANPKLLELAPVLLYRTLGPTLPDGAAPDPLLRPLGRAPASGPPPSRGRAAGGHRGARSQAGRGALRADPREPLRARLRRRHARERVAPRARPEHHRDPPRARAARRARPARHGSASGARPHVPLRALRGRAPF